MIVDAVLILKILDSISKGANAVKNTEAAFTPDQSTLSKDIAIAEALFPIALDLAKAIEVAAAKK